MQHFRRFLPLCLVFAAGALSQAPLDISISTDLQIVVLVALVFNWLSNEVTFRRAQGAHLEQLAAFKKFDTEPRSLPREFSIKMTTFLIATPDEIADALSNPEKRMRWDLNACTITKQDKNLSITYTTSQSRYLVSLQFLK